MGCRIGVFSRLEILQGLFLGSKDLMENLDRWDVLLGILLVPVGLILEFLIVLLVRCFRGNLLEDILHRLSAYRLRLDNCLGDILEGMASMVPELRCYLDIHFHLEVLEDMLESMVPEVWNYLDIRSHLEVLEDILESMVPGVRCCLGIRSRLEVLEDILETMVPGVWRSLGIHFRLGVLGGILESRVCCRCCCCWVENLSRDILREYFHLGFLVDILTVLEVLVLAVIPKDPRVCCCCCCCCYSEFLRWDRSLEHRVRFQVDFVDNYHREIP